MQDLAKPGDVIAGRYQIVEMLGRGSVADVYAARDGAHGREVAVKIMRHPLSRDREALERLNREARVQEMIDHPNVAKLFGGGVTDREQPYLVVELLRGTSLRQVVRRDGRVSPVRAASYCWQALQGLDSAHAVGVHHRDLKPANLMLEPSPGPVERVVLIDFGFAALEGAPRLTEQGKVVGTLAYLAPERLLGEPGDERSDLYALGVLLYELTVGRRPFVADSDLQLFKAHLEAVPTPPRRAAPEANIPRALETVILTALAKSPQARYDSARDMAAHLEEAAQG